MSWWYEQAYVSVAEKRRRAEKLIVKLRKTHADLKPICIEGRALAKSFWGKAWCKHMDQMADYENRLPRGRSYARNGAVCHLDVCRGEVEAWVSGSQLYTVTMRFKPLSDAHWALIQKACQGKISTLLELLQGKLSSDVMAVVAHPENGIFPKSRDISYSCSCPDHARLCKHVAAVFYGIGRRLDDEPELLFLLRGVDPAELFSLEGAVPTDADAPESLQGADLAGIFGIDLLEEAPAATAAAAAPPPEKDDSPRERASRVAPPAQSAAPPTQSAPPPAQSTPPAAGRRRTTRKKTPGNDARALPVLDITAVTGKDITQLREACGMSLSAFAARLGVVQPTLKRWEETPGVLQLHLPSRKKVQALYTKLCREREK